MEPLRNLLIMESKLITNISGSANRKAMLRAAAVPLTSNIRKLRYTSTQ